MNTTTGEMREDEEGHCTGTVALKVLQTILGEKISGMSTGESRIFR